ncbi:MAG: ATP-binding cassette domain-containing protein [Elusimicrobiota bacterium]|nr:ATP-binding cassette domain-containing protein [Elusimicrobiota bacterium]
MHNKPLVLKNVSLSVNNRPIFSNLNMSIAKGETVLLIGPSGSGKTTLLKLIMRLLEDADGWTVEGNISGLPESFGWVSQNPSRDIFNNWVEEEASEEHLRLFFAGHLAGRKCFELSEGEKVLVSLAKAFKHNFIFLDEASVSLSTQNRKILKNNILSCGAGVLMAEHNTEYIDLADKILLMKDGTVKNVGRGEAKEYLTHMPDGLRRTKSAIAHPERESLEIVSDRISLKVRRGEVVGISGDNGCGKSRLLNSIAGLDTGDTVKGRWQGKVLGDMKSRRGLMGFVPQEPGRYLFEITAEDQCRVFGIDEDRKKAFGLSFTPGIKTSYLSGGEKQRLAIAAAADKDIMILDEPTFGLDRTNISDLFRAVNRKCHDGGITLLASHDRRLLDLLCDRIIEL